MATKYRGTKTEVSCLNAYINLMRAAESVSIRVHSYLGEMRITYSQFAVLEVLLHLGPLTQNQIAKKILKTKGNMTMILDNLEKRELVKRSRLISDRRVQNITLTATGSKFIKKIFPIHVERVVKEFQVLTSEQKEQLRKTCRVLGKGILEEI